jgi:hypothetical protein
MRVLVCGGRDYNDSAKVARVLAEQNRMKPIDTLIEGGAPGADACAAMWARWNFIRIETFLADWKTHGKAAGPIRNRKMITEGKPDLLIAFPGGRGTADMVRQARLSGIVVREIT